MKLKNYAKAITLKTVVLFYFKKPLKIQNWDPKFTFGSAINRGDAFASMCKGACEKS